VYEKMHRVNIRRSIVSILFNTNY